MTLRVPIIIALSLAAAPLRAAESFLENHLGYCCKHRLFDAAPSTSTPVAPGSDAKFARDRLVDVHHLKLELRPDFEKRTIAGTATLSFSPIAKDLRRLDLDAVDLEIAAVDASVPLDDYHVADRQIEITFANPIPAGEKATVTVTYSAEPHLGLYFRTPAMGYPEGDAHFWTQGQPESHRYWFPGYDYPNERFTSEVICHVPEGMTVLSNGTLLSEKKEPAAGLVAFHWSQDTPHVNYLISVVAGYFRKLEARHGDLPIALYTVPSRFAEAPNSFRDTAKILAFLEKEIGVPYPWDKYYNVVVTDFVAGGMENTSVTTLTDQTLFTSAHENLRTSHRLDAHEAAHQWFGDLLTCKDWSHIWLNEGFATYYQVLYEGEKFGEDDLRYAMCLNADRVLKAGDDKPIVYRGYETPREQFDYRAYPKGAWVLHMLRSQLGPPLFRRCIQSYVMANANRNVVTEDLNRVIEEISGRSFDRFFDQWVHHGGHPDLEIKYTWDSLSSQSGITVTQKQKTGGRVPIFHFTLPVRFITEKGAQDFALEIDEASEDFFCKLAGQPRIVRIDPDYTLLSKISFAPPGPLLNAQLENQDDMMGRLLAVGILSKKKDQLTVSRLGRVLREDPFYGVRIEAAKALATIHNPEAFTALRESASQDDARVRGEIVRAIATFYRDETFDFLRDIVDKEKNPEIVSIALDGLGQFPNEEVRMLLIEALGRKSFRDEIAGAAVKAMRAQDVPAYVEPLLNRLARDEAAFTHSGHGDALEALGFLARHEEDREPVRSLIAARLEHPMEGIRVRAINALGALEDPRSLALLENYPLEPAERPENKAAAEAVKKLSAAKPQAAEVGDLRREVLDLEKELRDLREKLEALDKKVTPEKPAPAGK